MEDKFDYESYKGVEYLVRNITYTDKFGNSHCYNIADKELSDALWNDEIQDFDNSDIDNQYYCYAPVSILIIKEDQKVAEALSEYGIDMEL